MKKIVCFIMSLLLLTGCGKEQTSSVKEEQPHEIAFTMNGEFEYAHGYDTLKDLAHGGDLVVYGEVQEYHCEALGHFIYTFEQVRVDEVLYGDCEAGDTINVRKMMGETTLAEHIESLKTCEPSLAEEYEEKYSKEEQETLYVRWENPYDIESEAGQKSIHFLGDLGILEKYNAYGRINGTEGQYIELEDGTFENVREYAEDRENISGRTSTEPLEQPSIYTMDEMKDQIN